MPQNPRLVIKSYPVVRNQKFLLKKVKNQKSEEKPDFYDLSIIWETEAIGKKDKKDWKEACKKLSANFKLDPKSGSQGVFRKVKCIRLEKRSILRLCLQIGS